jgi:predicted HAD superfamily hydrolase
MSDIAHSFDVFDTSLTRLVGHPASLFYLQGRCLARAGDWMHGATQFAAARVEAERLARANTKAQEVTLAAIYAQLAHAHDLTNAQCESFMRLELELEESMLRPVPATQRALLNHRRNGSKILFVSDTYFPREVVREWLRRFGVSEPTDSVYASSETGVTKLTGDMFGLVMREENIVPAALLHTGDSTAADVVAPQALGIRTRWFEAGLLTAHERMMEQHTVRTDGVASLFAGASRHVRLAVDAADDRQRALRSLASQVAAPLLSVFVTWVLRRAHALGLKRLLFVARDGEVMLRMAKPLAKKLGLDFEMQYLYAGRQVVNLAGLNEIDEAALSWMTENAGNATLAEVLQRVGLELTPELADEAIRTGVATSGPVGWSHLDRLGAYLRAPLLKAPILDAAARTRAHVQAYFRANGLMDGAPCAIIDVGWRGRVFNSICQVIGPEHSARHTALYFGLFAKPNPLPAGDQQAFLFDLSGETPIGSGYDIPKLAQALEIFCQATHGQVLGLMRVGDGGFKPILRTEHNDVGPHWDVAYFQDCMAAYAQSLALDPSWCTPIPDLRPMCEQLLRKLMTEPTGEQARMLGAFHYNDDQGGAASEPFSRPYVLSDFRATFQQGQFPQKSMIWWQPGAAAMTTPRVLVALRLARRLSKLRSTRAWRFAHGCSVSLRRQAKF